MAERCALVVGRRVRRTTRRCGDDVSLAGLLREAARRALDDARDDLVGHRRRRDRHRPRHVRGRDDAGAVPRGRARGVGQADAARAHRRQRRGQHRHRGVEPHHRRCPQAGAHRRLREAVGGRHDLGARRWAQRQRRRRRLLRPAHPRVHRALEGAGVRRVDGGGEGPQERAAEPLRPPQGPGHQPGDGEGVPDGVGPGAPPRVLPGLRRRLRDGADRRGGRRRRVEAGGVAARHRRCAASSASSRGAIRSARRRARTAPPTCTARPASRTRSPTSTWSSATCPSAGTSRCGWRTSASRRWATAGS